MSSAGRAARPPLLPRILLALALCGTLPPSLFAAERREAVTGMPFVLVEGGGYHRGDFSGLGIPREQPPHPVAVSDFYLGRYEVTVGQFRTFADETGYLTVAEKAGEVIDIDAAMGTFVRRPGISWRNPGFGQGESDPVVWVSWSDAEAFTTWLAERSSLPYRLPTEAEWEFAARERGREQRWAGTADRGALGRFSWYAANSGGRPHPVGGKAPNALGLYDMSGNVWEWCLDWQDRYPASGERLQDPRGDNPNGLRALRGGSWRVGEEIVTTTYRNGYKIGYAHSSIGFRVALPAADLTALPVREWR